MPMRYSVSTWQQPLPETASPQRAALLDRLAGEIAQHGENRLAVGIDGFTAAGKTSLGHELGVRIAAAGRPVLRACLDDFKRPWRDRHRYDRKSGEGYYRNAFDYDALKRLLLHPFRDGGEVALCGIDPLTQVDHSGTTVESTPGTVLIVDGVFAFRPEIDSYWDYRIWVDVDAELSVTRGTSRDQDWARQQAEAIHRDRYLVAERLYLSEVDPLPRMDAVIDNTDFAAPRLSTGGSQG